MPDVPRIPQDYVDCVAYLYPTETAAEKGQKVGGSGFLVGVEFADTPSLAHAYIVTNSHVAANNKVVRVNTRDGPKSKPVVSWHHSPSGADVMVGDLILNEAFDDRVTFLRPSAFITPERMESIPLRHGDEIFMISRFAAHEGVVGNEPVVRFGTLAKRRPVLVKNERLGAMEESFLAEMRSLPGHSGSPTLVYFTGMAARLGADEEPPTPAVYVLGINWGHLPQTAPVLAPPEGGLGEAKPVPEKWYVEENSGMACVVPAWKVNEILEQDEVLVSRRAETEAAWAEFQQRTYPDGGAVADVVGDVVEEDGEEFDRFQELTRKLVHTPKAKRRKPPSGPAPA